MHRVLAGLLLGLVASNPCWSQNPCPAGTDLPVNVFIAPPICAGQPLRLRAEACGPCVDLVGWKDGPPYQIHAFMDPRNCVLEICRLETEEITIGTFAAGHHTLVYEVLGTVAGPESTFCTFTRQDTVVFDVPQTCVPPPGPLPYTNEIQIGPPPPCPTCPAPPICPSRDIPFHIAGTFPNTCYEFRGLEFLPSPIASPLPQPPIARVHVTRNECPGVQCHFGPVPWKAQAVLPGLPPGNYRMMVELLESGVCDSTDTLYTTVVPFTVAADCSLPPQQSCYLHSWQRDSAGSECNARIGSGTPARLVFQILACQGLAALQGKFVLAPPALRIAELRTVGPASGMRLVWQEAPDGARFVLVADEGAPIGALPCELRFFTGDPVLEVTVAPRPGVPIPAVSELDVQELLAADSLGREVIPCPTFAPIAPALICSGRSCDLNADGRVDVRDLVLMIRCVRGLDRCAASALDCNGDGTISVDDVLCCARAILNGPMPDSVATRPAPELYVSVGAGTVTANGVDLPIRVHRADLVGAGRLAFSYPADRFDQATVELLGDAADWLEVSEAAGGRMIVGLIAGAPAEQIADVLDLVLHFRLAAGRQPSSDIRLVESEFAGPDGVALASGAPTTSVPLPTLVFELSEARPNPFTRETRFVLDVSRPTNADLGIFDLSGRRVATLHRGRLETGPHTFRWDGTRSDGSRAPSGVYFYRAQAGGVHAARKLVLVGE